MKRKHCTAIVLAAGRGTRMGSKVHKQYLLLEDKPVLYYCLKAFQDSDLIDDICLVTGAGEEAYCRENIIEKYEVTKVSKIICGGTERYHSVWNGLKEIVEEGYVLIHDGARPFVDADIIYRALDVVKTKKACVAGMPVKDTIKVADNNGTVQNTPDRSGLWLVQTPQAFETGIIKDAYSKLIRENYTNVTDDAMVIEQMLGLSVQLFYGSYDNIKITTPEDLEMAEVFLKRRRKREIG